MGPCANTNGEYGYAVFSEKELDPVLFAELFERDPLGSTRSKFLRSRNQIEFPQFSTY